MSDASFQCILESKYAVINILRPLSECEKLLLAARLQRQAGDGGGQGNHNYGGRRQDVSSDRVNKHRPRHVSDV